MRIPEPCTNSEAARDLMVGYVSRSCSLEEGLDFVIHCLSCEECVTTLSLILRLSRSPASKEAGRALASLYTIGLKAASVARLRTKIEVSLSARAAQPRLGLAVTAKAADQ